MGKDSDVLRHFLQHEPGLARPISLFEGIKAIRQELPQSLCLAWLLSPRGPLTDCWLLRRLFAFCRPEVAWPGLPVRVTAAAEDGSDRPDIVIEWSGLILVVEYKVFSPEGHSQIQRYLDKFIPSLARGWLLLVTPNGRRPTSVEDVEETRVRGLGFAQLIQLIDEGLSTGVEPSERGRVLAAEYRECLKRVLNRNFTMTKPVIAEATKLLTAEHDRFDRLRAAAMEQAADYLEWLVAQAEKRLRDILGDDMIRSDWPDWGVFMFRRPKWQAKGLAYGVAITLEDAIGNLLIHEYEPTVCVRVEPYPDQKAQVPYQKQFSEQLKSVALKHWRRPISDWNKWYAFYHYLPFEADTDWDKWADEVLNLLCQIAQTLAPVLDNFMFNKLTRR